MRRQKWNIFTSECSLDYVTKTFFRHGLAKNWSWRYHKRNNINFTSSTAPPLIVDRLSNRLDNRLKHFVCFAISHRYDTEKKFAWRTYKENSHSSPLRITLIYFIIFFTDAFDAYLITIEKLYATIELMWTERKIMLMALDIAPSGTEAPSHEISDAFRTHVTTIHRLIIPISKFIDLV